MADLRQGVHPLLLEKIDHVLATMADLGHPMRICQGVRTASQQAKLYAQGRTTPGPFVSAAFPLGHTVTNADGVAHLSNHQPKADGYGHAVDCCFQGDDPFLERDPQGAAKWKTYGALVKAVGLVWGGDWSSIIDRPHAELPGLPSSKGPAAGGTAI